MIPTQDSGQCSEKPSGKALFLNEAGLPVKGRLLQSSSQALWATRE